MSLLSLEEIVISSRINHILKKIEDINFFIEDIKEKIKILSNYTVDSDDIYQQLYTNMLSFYDDYNEQLSQLNDINLIKKIGIVKIIVYQKINEKRIKKEIKQYLKFFYDLYSDVNNINKPSNN